ncbi:lipopolysaccharide kinase InaA family protein [Methylobacillus gramineus]|uniref:lipopolysaccharide kinase InaA family protein n=1 Tax=Methylobacillus gramineus TaxID=755169 RepID=UPI001CFF752B|nr:lipopolysaccharide kinase InaA family protein [Methylobacillus gramineus]MCB5184903.1 lipopolysaccharide kinase InaA family protein [Methylobacillus gramineus]
MTDILHNPDLAAYTRHQAAEYFAVTLDDGNQLERLQIIRRVPGKRLVCRGYWRGREVFAKFFIGQQSAKYLARDRRGSQYLSAAGITTPSLLLQATIAAQSCHLLLYAAVNAPNAEEIWQALIEDESAQFALAGRLVEEVAYHHAAGLYQSDLYLKNFLVDADHIYTLDGDGIRRLRPYFKRCQALQNLALLLSKLDVYALEGWLPALLVKYAAALGYGTVPAVPAMQRRIAKHRAEEMRQYADKKVLRTCTDVVVVKRPTYFLAINRARDSVILRDSLKRPDALLDAPSATRLKSGNTCTVAAIEIDQRKMVIKRYNIKSFWHGLGRAFRSSRAVVSWSNAHRLMIAGLATPQVIAVLERRYWLWRKQAYLLTEFVSAPDAVVFFADQAIVLAQKQQVAQGIARLFYRLYLLRLEHGDFKATNLLIHGTVPLLIDLDSMRQYLCHATFRPRHIRDVRRFMKNWQSDAEVRHLLIEAFRAVYRDTDLLDQAGLVIKQSERQ